MIQIPNDVANLKLPAPELVTYYSDLKRKTLWLDYPICEGITFELVKNIIQFNIEDFGIEKEERLPIKLFINTPGGDVNEGMTLIDVIESSETPVWCVNIGTAYSMGFLVMLAGDKRIGMKNSSYLLHDGSQFIQDSGSKARDFMKFNEQTERRIKEYVVSKTNITLKQYEARERFEWYMHSAEAKDLGVIDCVIGEDGFGLDELFDLY